MHNTDNVHTVGFIRQYTPLCICIRQNIKADKTRSLKTRVRVSVMHHEASVLERSKAEIIP